MAIVIYINCKTRKLNPSMLYETGDTNLFSLLQRDKGGISHAKSILLTQLSCAADKKTKKRLVSDYSDYVIEVGEQRCKKNRIFSVISLLKGNLQLVCKVFVYGMLLMLFLLLVFDFFDYFWSCVLGINS